MANCVEYQEINSKTYFFPLHCHWGGGALKLCAHKIPLGAPKRLGPALTGCVGMDEFIYLTRHVS